MDEEKAIDQETEAFFEDYKEEIEVEQASLPVRYETINEIKASIREKVAPVMVRAYLELLIDPDPEVRRKTASEVAEILGLKGKSASSESPLNAFQFNFTGQGAVEGIEGLKKAEVIDVEGRADRDSTPSAENQTEGSD